MREQYKLKRLTKIIIKFKFKSEASSSPMTQVTDTTKGPDPKVDSPSDSKTELLIRQVEMKVA